MTDETTKRRAAKVHVDNLPGGAPIWFIGWLFTIGYVEPTLLQALLGILLWPFQLGAELRAR